MQPSPFTSSRMEMRSRGGRERSWRYGYSGVSAIQSRPLESQSIEIGFSISGSEGGHEVDGEIGRDVDFCGRFGWRGGTTFRVEQRSHFLLAGGGRGITFSGPGNPAQKDGAKVRKIERLVVVAGDANERAISVLLISPHLGNDVVDGRKQTPLVLVARVGLVRGRQDVGRRHQVEIVIDFIVKIEV